MTFSSKNLNESSIKALAGDAVFQRGYVYLNEGRVSLISQNKTSTELRVDGSETYLVKLKHTSKQFEATCQCPAAQGFDFCKHCVAGSLFYLQLIAEKETLKKSSGKDLLQAYLKSLPKDQLIAALTEHINRNPLTLQNWMLRAETAAEKLDEKSFKKHITAAIPYHRHLHRHQQVRAFFRKIESLIERLDEESSQLKPEHILKLVDYAILRIRRALETIDDSAGYRLRSLEMIGNLHCNALSNCALSSQHKADYLLSIYLGENYDFYATIPESYEAVIEKEAVTLFFQKLSQRWEALPNLNPDGEDTKHFDRKLDYLHTLAPLLKKARAENNVEQEIRYLEKSATNVRDMVALSALHSESGNMDMANTWLKKAESLSHQSGYRADIESVVDQKIELLVVENNVELALQIRWQRFEETLTCEEFIRLKEIGKRLDNAIDYYQKASSALQQQLIKSDDGELAAELTRIHLHENKASAACATANAYPLPIDLLEQVIYVNTHRFSQILPLLERAIQFRLKNQGAQEYEGVVQLLHAVKEKIKKKDQKSLNLFVEKLVASHQAKRKLVALIENLF